MHSGRNSVFSETSSIVFRMRNKILLFSLVFACFAISVQARVCLWARGRVSCPDSYRNHDGRVVKVRLVDASRGTLDSGYASKSGRFALFGCHPSSGTHAYHFQPEVHILHDCKSNQQRRIIIPVRHTSSHEYNITNLIDLEAFYEDETPHAVDLTGPCSRN